MTRQHSAAAVFGVAILIAGSMIVVAACGSAATGGPSLAPASGSPGAASSPAESESAESGTTSGDVPDNAVFLTFHDPKLGFLIDYVEGWQVARAGDGVTIRDKDSSEVVRIVPGQTDAESYLAGTDLPALKAQSGFVLVKQDRVSVVGTSLVHLAYHQPAPPDPVTGKQVSSTVDRYYIAGPAGIAVVSLSTPDGIDNVDAFRQMIESFRWA